MCVCTLVMRRAHTRKLGVHINVSSKNVFAQISSYFSLSCAHVHVHTGHETCAHKKTRSTHKCFFQKCFCTNFFIFFSKLCGVCACTLVMRRAHTRKLEVHINVSSKNVIAQISSYFYLSCVHLHTSHETHSHKTTLSTHKCFF